MKKIRTILAYIFAAMAVPILLATFIGSDFWAKKLVAGTGLAVSPWYTGGEVTSVLERRQYKLAVHRPVFDGLFGSRASGFIQLDIEPAGETLPAEIVEKIDIDADGSSDFQITVDTANKTAKINSTDPRICGVENVTAVGEKRLIRVLLRNTR
jgi:hypothetical protein